MTTLATLSRTTKKGKTSTWYFVETPDGYFAFGGCDTPSIKKCDTKDALRSLYQNWVKYGYRPVTQQLELPV